MCGGDPKLQPAFDKVGKYSPRVWRWSLMLHKPFKLLLVFSTCVEVILLRNTFASLVESILHVCGGDPIIVVIAELMCMYSPRVWRWSYDDSKKSTTNSVFSTCVEVIPRKRFKKSTTSGILHVCGGDPTVIEDTKLSWKYSPRVWRCSYAEWRACHDYRVFSTYVEAETAVFLYYRLFMISSSEYL